MAKTSKKTQTTTSAPVAATPASLGNKRQCHSCGTKFYDFGKEEPNCPKCNTKVTQANAKYVAKAEKKRAPVVEVEDDPVIETEEIASPEFESLESLEEEAEDLVENIGAVDKDEEDEGF